MTADPLESGTVKVRLGGEGYNRKTLNRGKRSVPKQQVGKSRTVSQKVVGGRGQLSGYQDVR